MSMMLSMKKGGNILLGYQRSLDGEIYHGYNLLSYCMFKIRRT